MIEAGMGPQMLSTNLPLDASNKVLKSMINSENPEVKKQVAELEQDKKKNLDEIKELKSEIKQLKAENNEINTTLENTEQLYENQVQEYKKLVNKKEHTQEVLNKQQLELNEAMRKLEKYSYAMGKLENMSFIDRLFNRIPEEVKELASAEAEEDS